MDVEVLPPIEALSNDEVLPGSSTDSKPQQPAAKRRKSGDFGSESVKSRTRQEIRSDVSKVIARTCECARWRRRGHQQSCFLPFSTNPSAVDSVVSLKFELQSMHKQDADDKAFLALKD